jgi:RNA polymerase sigma factor (sigma-70 family)
LDHLSDDKVRAAFEAPGTPEGEAACALLWQFLCRSAFKLMGGDRYWTEEVAQEALSRAFEGYPRFRGKCKITTWCHAVLFNVYRETLRKEGVARAITGTDDGGGDPVDPGFIAALKACLAKLSATHQAVFRYIVWEGKKAQEVARLMSTTKGNVSHLLYELRGRVRACLEESYFARR